MKGPSSSNDLQSLLLAIKTSDVVENRIQLLINLKELEITDKSEVAYLVGALTTFWEDFTCLDISQCTMNKAILDIAKKYVESDTSRFPDELLGLGRKAISWCSKHLKMTLMSTDESQEEEHNILFYQLLMNLLSYSASSFSALARSSFSISHVLIPTIENFISEVLSLTKDALSAIKRMDAAGSEIQKVSHVVLDAAIQLCKVYCQGTDWGSESLIREEMQLIVSEASSNTGHIINIAKITVDKLCEVGVLAANDGGSLVSVLNLSWKGVVTLLQLGKGALATKLNVEGVVLTLISLANQSLKRAAESWSLKLEGAVQLTEAKRIFLPVKFYLINAVRIISQYPTRAFSVYKEVIGCVVLISCFKVCLSKEENLKFAAEALGETLEPASFHLLNSILNSVHVKQEEKFQVLDWLFGDDIDPKLFPLVSGNGGVLNSTDAVHLKSDAKGGGSALSLGQVNLFLYLLRSSSDFEYHIKAWMARKLQWLLDILMHEDVYHITLSLQVHTTYASCQDQKVVYKPFLHCILDALRTFMVVMSSHGTRGEIEYFLLENLLHPHFLCREIVNDLWCFILRHAETDLVNDIIDKLCSLLAYTASTESVLSSGSALRQMARSICLIVTYGSQAVTDQVYNFVAGGNKSHYSLNMYTAMLMEGFPLNLLPERTRSTAKQKIITDYFCFVENFTSELPRVGGFETYGAPVFALSAALHFQQVSLSDAEMKTLRFLVAVIDKYKNAEDNKVKDLYCRLLSEVLGIISHIKNLYSSDDMEGVIMELHDLFISRPSSLASDRRLFCCKPNLANFMSGIALIELAENDDNTKSAAVWGLYHMLLREQHWAFAHLAMTAFGYFAGHTSCNQLWRFLPEDAALSFDLESGNVAEQERFMCELKGFLEKESASLLMKPGPDHIAMLLEEGLKLKEIVHTIIKIKEEAATRDNAMEIDEENQGKKKRKLPDGISKGVELLQNGLKVMGDSLSQWQHNQIDRTEVQDVFLKHFSRLEDVVSNLVGLAGDT